MNKETRLSLESNQTIIRDRLANKLFSSPDFESRLRGIDLRITQILKEDKN